MPVGDQIVDYVNPARDEAAFDLPIEPGQEGVLLGQGIEALYGAPIYEHDSLMSGRPRFLGHAALARRCIDHVASRGGAAFFGSPDWHRQLDGVVARWQAEHGERGLVEDEAALQRAIVADLRQARALIEQHLTSHPVRHLCLPYTIGSAAAVRAAREAGHQSCFWGVRADRSHNRPGDDPFHCPRLKADYIFRLPGRGRRPLAAILWHKIGRRLAGRPVH